MKYILKNPKNEPAALVRFRAMAGVNYSAYGDRDTVSGEEKPLKKALAREQHFICCYCMRRIEIVAMTVEHYISQNHHSSSPLAPEVHASKTLDYMNMLGCCNSDERNCSGIRGNTWITVDPRNQICEQLIRLDKVGRVYSRNPVLQHEIQNILHLNDDNLILNRQKVIETAKERLMRKKKSGTWTTSLIQKEIDYWLTPHLGQNGELVYREYCLAAVHYLQSKMQKAQ